MALIFPFLLAQVAYVTAEGVPFPWAPPSQLPTLNGSAFPPFRTVFFQGECTANDLKGGINQNKTCFSCFRIPTVLAGQTSHKLRKIKLQKGKPVETPAVLNPLADAVRHNVQLSQAREQVTSGGLHARGAACAPS